VDSLEEMEEISIRERWRERRASEVWGWRVEVDSGVMGIWRVVERAAKLRAMGKCFDNIILVLSEVVSVPNSLNWRLQELWGRLNLRNGAR